MNKRYLLTGISVLLCSGMIALATSIKSKESSSVGVLNDNSLNGINIKMDFTNKTSKDMRDYYTNEGQEFIKKILPDSISSDFALLNVGKQLDKELKDIKFTTINGKEISLKDLKGKKILIDFALTTCGTCEKELNFMSSYDFEKEGIEYIHIYPRDNTSSVKSFYAKTNSKLNEDHIVSETGLNGFRLDDLSITNVPAKIFIDENGIIQYAFVDAITDKETLQLHLERAFDLDTPKILDYLKDESEIEIQADSNTDKDTKEIE